MGRHKKLKKTKEDVKSLIHDKNKFLEYIKGCYKKVGARPTRNEWVSADFTECCPLCSIYAAETGIPLDAIGHTDIAPFVQNKLGVDKEWTDSFQFGIDYYGFLALNKDASTLGMFMRDELLSGKEKFR